MNPTSSQILLPGLYLVATPIGNLRDITLRALDVLQAASIIACEDTRVTGVLCKHYGLRAPLVSCHEHNEASRLPEIIEAVKAGKIVALVSDAGTPLVSDPGYRLARAAMAEGIEVFPIPGASSVLAALNKSGLPSDRFCFAGFLPSKTAAIREFIAELKPIPATLVMFESPRRLSHSLELLAEILGDRQATVCRELTKLYEEARQGTLPQLAAHYLQADTPKGEVVLVIAPPQKEVLAYRPQPHDLQLAALLKNHSLKEAVEIFTEATGLPRKEIYSRALDLKSAP